jgi:hypothetical protein
MERVIKKVSHGLASLPQSHFAVPTMEGMALGPPPVRTMASLAAHHAATFRHGGEEENWAGKAPPGGRGSLRRFGGGNDDVWYGQAAQGAADRSHGGRGKLPGRSPVCLRSKPECGFVSKEIVLATPPSIKGSEGDPRGGSVRPYPLERCAAAPHGGAAGAGRRGG